MKMNRWAKWAMGMSLLFCMLLTCPAVLSEREGFFSVLLVGEDDADSEVVVESEAYGRADAILLASLHKETGAAKLLSIDRDYRVTGPDGRETKLALVNQTDGPERLLEAVSALLGLKMDGYAMVSKADMAAIVERMGGLTLYISEVEMAYVGVKRPGKQHLSAEQVVRFMSGRDRSATADIDRNDRQRQVLMAMLEQALSGGAEEMISFVTAVLPLVDTNLSLRAVLPLSQTLLSGGLSRPAYDRTPRAADRIVEVAGGHFVVMAADMEAEQIRVHAFLYGDA